jgi:heme exporter protein CcmD
MSYVAAAYGITILSLVFYAASLHRERRQQLDDERRHRS